MTVRALRVPGVHEITSPVFEDARGSFTSTFLSSTIEEATGRPPFRVAQISSSVSRRGTVRGLHHTATPPGMAKYVHCTAGRVLDVVVDLRIGSPTFGVHDAVELDRASGRTLSIPHGVGHLFVALEEGSTVNYALSREYEARNEYAVSPFDLDLALPMPADLEPVLSERDRRAPTLAQARSLGQLPDLAACLALDTGRTGGHVSTP